MVPTYLGCPLPLMRQRAKGCCPATEPPPKCPSNATTMQPTAITLATQCNQPCQASALNYLTHKRSHTPIGRRRYPRPHASRAWSCPPPRPRPRRKPRSASYKMVSTHICGDPACILASHIRWQDEDANALDRDHHKRYNVVPMVRTRTSRLHRVSRLSWKVKEGWKVTTE